MNWMDLLIPVISGIVGGNIAGSVMKKNSLGTIGNSIVGLLGGGIGAQVLSALGADPAAGMATGASFDFGSLIAGIAGGGTGGALLLAATGLLKGFFARKPKR